MSLTAVASFHVPGPRRAGSGLLIVCRLVFTGWLVWGSGGSGLRVHGGRGRRRLRSRGGYGLRRA
ncbi:hypothetical protein, partial [Streptomyces sp. NPDC001719]